MDREDLILRLLCACAIAERDGFVFFADALANLLHDMVNLDPSSSTFATQGSEPVNPLAGPRGC